MRIEHDGMKFELPDSLHTKLSRFRQRVWSVKLAEGVFSVATLAALTFLAVFVLDRLGETPAWLRAVLFLLALVGLFVGLPMKVYRWIWSQRKLEQLARLLERDQPRVGDRLLGVIELVHNRQDRHASPALCRAAIQQVADDTREIDFLKSVPQPRHRRWGVTAVVVLLISLGALAVPGAGLNAFQRWLRPWADISRYTFTQLVDVPSRQVVAIGEPFELDVVLDEQTKWQPETGKAQYGDQAAVIAERTARGYRFSVPAQTEPGTLHLAIGDARHSIDVQPMTRPELRALTAQIELPAYLQYKDEQRDARSGTISIVKGSVARFEAVASRPLADATVNDVSDGVQVTGEKIASAPVEVEDSVAQEIRWTDIEGLSAKSPFRLRIRAIDDRAPNVQCSDLPMEKVILDEETLSFEVAAGDDFGVKAVGVEWNGLEDPRRNPDPQKGEYQLAGGKPSDASLTVAGVFSPKSIGVKPQPIHLRVYAEDYLPGRERVYSPVYRLYVLNREQHMIWVTQQLEQWERQALEVRDEEQRLLNTNRELQQLSPEQLDQDATRQRIARQAAAERANARRLNSLSLSGEDLISEATRNPEFNVATLEKWAQVLQTLKQLSNKNMPSVANQLATAANAGKAGAPKPKTAPSVSDSVRGAATDPKPGDDANKDGAPPKPSKGGGSLQLPVTALPGQPGKDQPQNGQDSPAGQSVDQAVEEQEALLAEFNRVMDELSQVLQDLQGSTFVKRLKAAADAELKMASDLHEELPSAFGSDTATLADPNRQLLERLYTQQNDTTRDVRLIQEDLTAFFERTQRQNFKDVFEEMKDTEVVRNFKELSEAVLENQSGYTIAQAEFWADQLDRWAEMLVGPGCAGNGQCPGGKGDSLPPSIVLEVLRILKAEVDLRESTRVVEQTRTINEPEAYRDASQELEDVQSRLHQRTQLVMDQLERLQIDEGKNYGKPLKQLSVARNAMKDAVDLLSQPATDGPTIAAETEAIEALLITKRVKPGGGGGGGGSTPGGGGGEGAADIPSALAGIGDDVMTEVREVAQSTGSAGTSIPAEFQGGLDAYFNAINGQEGF